MQRLGIDGAQLTQMWLQYRSLLACTLIRVQCLICKCGFEMCHVLGAWATSCGIIWNSKASATAVELRYMYRSRLVMNLCRVIHKQI